MPAISDIWLALTLVQEAPECVASFAGGDPRCKKQGSPDSRPTPWNRVRSGLYLKIGRNSGLLVQPGIGALRSPFCRQRYAESGAEQQDGKGFRSTCIEGSSDVECSGVVPAPESRRKRVAVIETPREQQEP